MALFDGDRIAALAALLVRDLLGLLPDNEHVPTVRLMEVAATVPSHGWPSQLP